MKNGMEVLRLIKSQARNVPKLYIRALKDIYNDDWQDLIEDEIAKQFSTRAFEKLSLLYSKEFNLLKNVVTRLSLVYKSRPMRRAITENGSEDKAYKAVNQTRLNVVLKKVNRLTNLMNHVLLHVSYRDGELDYDIIGFDNAEIYTYKNNCRKIKAIRYYNNLTLPSFASLDSYDLNTLETYDTSYLYIREEDESITLHIYEMDSAGNEILVESIEQNYLDKNGRHIFPFVLFSKEYPDESLLNFTKGSDLVDATINTAINIAHLNELIKYQSHIQGVITTSEPAKFGERLRLGAGEWLVLGRGENALGDEKEDSAKLLNLQSDYDRLWETIRSRMASVLSQEGIAPENFTVSGSPASAAALRISNRALLDRHKDSVELYQGYEENLFEVCRAVLAEDAGILMDKSSSLNIEFYDLEKELLEDEDRLFGNR